MSCMHIFIRLPCDSFLGLRGGRDFLGVPLGRGSSSSITSDMSSACCCASAHDRSLLGTRRSGQTEGIPIAAAFSAIVFLERLSSSS